MLFEDALFGLGVSRAVTESMPDNVLAEQYTERKLRALKNASHAD